MPRRLSTISPDWWDFTTLDTGILQAAAKLTVRGLQQLSRPGFKVVIYDTLEDFYLAEALEYIDAWRQSTPDNPAGLCGPIGPTEQLPLVARIVNALGLDVREGHFWAMDEWVDPATGRTMEPSNPLSFERCDRELCFKRITPALRPSEAHLHFPGADLEPYKQSWHAGVRCVVMQGGQGDVKHWAFNDPPRRAGKWKHEPPPSSEYRKLGARVVDLHPLTVAQNARTSGGGDVSAIPNKAVTVGPAETWTAEKVSIWHAGKHDSPFGQRLTAFMISKGIVDVSTPMSLLADHPNVQFNYYRGGLGVTGVEMH
jgi:glucosamine-6-phosphate deaminase